MRKSKPKTPHRRLARKRLLSNIEALEPRRVLDGSIEGVVWNDWDRDGVQQGGDREYQLASVEVNLLDAAGDVVETTQTNKHGEYDFSGVDSGTFVVEFLAPEETQFTEPRQTPVYYQDSDADPISGRTQPFNLFTGQRINGVDAGVYSRNGTPTISGVAWNDTVLDGLRGDLEPRLPGVEVQLENANRVKLLETVTDAVGQYSFPGYQLVPGDYFIEFKDPEDGLDWAFTQKHVFDGTEGRTDSDVSQRSGRSNIIELNDAGSEAPRQIVHVDAGYFIGAQIIGSVWNDRDQNGQQHLSEHGVADIIVRLRSSGGGLIDETTTDAQGGYSFGVEVGTYQVEFELPAATQFTTADVGPDAYDSDVRLATGRSPVFQVAQNAQAIQIDAGVFATQPMPDLVGFVWHDFNANGLQDSGEPGLAGVEVELENSRFGELLEVVTDRNGAYRILGEGLIPGRYHVDFNRPDKDNDWQISPRNVGGTDTTFDSDAHPLNGKSRLLSIGPNDDTIKADGAYFLFGSIEGGVWDDVKGNGLRELVEPLMPGVSVKLLDEDGEQLDTRRTNREGRYEFTELVPGNYRVEVERLIGAAFTRRLDTSLSDHVSAVDPQTGVSNLFTVQSNRTIQVWGGIGGTTLKTGIMGVVWDDDAGDGIREHDDAGMQGVRVQAFGPEFDLVATVHTDADGRYEFGDLGPGAYTLEFLPPENTTFSPMRRGADGRSDSDVNRSTWRTPRLSLAANQFNDSVDAGIYQGDLADDVLKSLRITEVAFIGHGATEFAEVKNIGDRPLDLTGVHFSDGVEFEFSKSSIDSLFPGEAAIVVGARSEFGEEVDVESINIAGAYDGDLDRDERLEISDALSRQVSVVDYTHEWYVIMEDEFQPWTLNVVDQYAPAEDWNLRSNWGPSSFREGTPGYDDPRQTPEADSIVINEVLTKSSDGFNDLIELHNTTDEDIDISFWYLGDHTSGQNPEIYLTRYRIGPGTVIPANGYRVFSREAQFANPIDPGLNSRFGLSSFGESVHLVAADRFGNLLGYSASATFLGTDIDVSYGRVPLSGGESTFLPMAEPTFGGPNSEPTIGDLVIDQVMYNTEATGEYIRVRNRTDRAIVMDEPWLISGAIKYQFPKNTIIRANSYALLVSTTPDRFRAANGVSGEEQILGPFSGRLGNSGEAIELVRPGGLGRNVLVDRVNYKSAAPWPQARLNAALIRASLETPGDEPGNWVTTTDDRLEFLARGIAVDQLFTSESAHIYGNDVLGQFVRDLLPGDANGDDRFDSQDIVQIFQQGHYRANVATDWRFGDWTRDRVFDERDLVWAFSNNVYMR